MAKRTGAGTEATRGGGGWRLSVTFLFIVLVCLFLGQVQGACFKVHSEVLTGDNEGVPALAPIPIYTGQ